jgi:hypothetical protein
MLFGDQAFLDDLAFSLVQIYTDAEQTCRVINEMHTGDWWWSIQVCNVTYDEHGDSDIGLRTVRLTGTAVQLMVK